MRFTNQGDFQDSPMACMPPDESTTIVRSGKTPASAHMATGAAKGMEKHADGRRRCSHLSSDAVCRRLVEGSTPPVRNGVLALHRVARHDGTKGLKASRIMSRKLDHGLIRKLIRSAIMAGFGECRAGFKCINIHE